MNIELLKQIPYLSNLFDEVLSKNDYRGVWTDYNPLNKPLSPSFDQLRQKLAETWKLVYGNNEFMAVHYSSYKNKESILNHGIKPTASRNIGFVKYYLDRPRSIREGFASRVEEILMPEKSFGHSYSGNINLKDAGAFILDPNDEITKEESIAFVLSGIRTAGFNWINTPMKRSVKSVLAIDLSIDEAGVDQAVEEYIKQNGSRIVTWSIVNGDRFYEVRKELKQKAILYIWMNRFINALTKKNPAMKTIKIDMKSYQIFFPYIHKIMTPEQWAYSLELYKKIQDKARGKVEYISSGTGISEVLLSTNPSEVDMVDFFIPSYDDFSKYVKQKWNEEDEVDFIQNVYINNKRISGFGQGNTISTSFSACLVAELKALGLAKRDLEINPLSNGFQIHFKKKHPLSIKEEDYVFNFINRDFRDYHPLHKFDIIFHKAGWQLFKHINYADWMKVHAGEMLEPKGYVVFNPYDYEPLVPIDKEIPIKKALLSTKRFKSIGMTRAYYKFEKRLLKFFPSIGYGWRMNILQFTNEAMTTLNAYHHQYEQREGGINLNPAQMSFQIKKSDKNFKFDFKGPEINAAQITGISFSIESIEPVKDLPAILGSNAFFS